MRSRVFHGDTWGSGTAGKKRRFANKCQQFPGCDYTADEIEFMRAIEEFKRRERRKFPSWCEVLAVLMALGYRKAA